jgi:hypothetical protein
MSKARDIASAAPAPSTVSATELGYVDGVTSAIQTQLDAKTAKSTLTTTGDIYYASGANTPARLGIGSTGNVLTVASGIPSWAAPAGGGKVLQVVSNTITSGANVTSTTFTDSDITATITPTLNTSKIMIFISAAIFTERTSADAFAKYKVLRGATALATGNTYFVAARGAASATNGTAQQASFTYLDSPATTSATTYKMQIGVETAGSGSYVACSPGGSPSTITLFEIGA